MNGLGVDVQRISSLTHSAFAILNEYYEAVGVMQRDTSAELKAILSDPASGIWLAKSKRKVVGCVMLRPLPGIKSAVECKRLYVRPAGRGQGVAGRMMDALEEYALRSGAVWVYLDSKDELTAAIALYTKRGYRPCARYNDNPQATVFLRKRLR